MSKREFVTGAPLGQRHTVNQSDDAEMEAAFDMLAEKLAPMVAELLKDKGETTTNAGSNGRKLNPSDITSRHFQGLPKGDEFDTLPDGDDAPARGGDHYDNLPPD